MPHIETFTKLFRSITDSTVWFEPDHTRICWITLLAMADRDGYVAASIPGIAGRARIPLDAARVAMQKFQEPDPDSRSPEYEGRRIEAADRGWLILNYERFRDMRDEDARREYERERKRAQRKRKMSGTVTPSPVMSHDVTQCLPNAEAETEAEEESKKKKERFALPVGLSEELWRDFKEHRQRLRKPLTNRAEAMILNKLIALGGDPNVLVSTAIERGWSSVFPSSETSPWFKVMSLACDIRTAATKADARMNAAVTVAGGWRAIGTATDYQLNDLKKRFMEAYASADGKRTGKAGDGIAIREMANGHDGST